jgi:hypothetical protein
MQMYRDRDRVEREREGGRERNQVQKIKLRQREGGRKRERTLMYTTN